MTKNANEPANPIVAGNIVECLGLTKREHFAGLAMAAIITAQLGFDRTGRLPGPDLIARWATSAADSLLEELEKPVDNTQ